MPKCNMSVIDNASNEIIASILILFIFTFLQAEFCSAQSPDRTCLQQFENAGKTCVSQLPPQQNSMPVLQRCIQEKLSAECNKQMSTAQKHVSQTLPVCTEANQRYVQTLKTTCGNLTKENEACYNRIRREFEPEIEAACAGMQ